MRAAGLFLLYFGLIASLVVPAPVLYDSDAYYHLAVARLYNQHGVFARIPWGRMSILAEGGDKDFLFHVILMPFVAAGGTAGGRIALALMNAAVALLIAVAAMRALGGIGAIVPVWLWIVAPPFAGRMMRLRPELLALAILLAALLPTKRRPQWLALFAFLFTLAYTAFHVFLALCLAWTVLDALPQRKRGASWGTAFRPFLWPVAGTAAGLLIRPHPLANFRIWFVQNVEFFLHKATLDVGNEITPPDAWYLVSSLTFVAGLVLIVWIASRRDGTPAAAVPPDAPDVEAAWRRSLAAAIVFVVLFAAMARMATYAYPLMLFAALAWIEMRRPVAAALRRSFTLQTAAVLVMCMVVAAPMAASSQAFHILRSNGTPERAWEAFGAAVPNGARVAADWTLSEHLAWFAPQASYLNVLDPVFMAVPHPKESKALRSLLRGHDPDIPVTLTSVLDSDSLIFAPADASEALRARVAGDPRLVLARRGTCALVGVDRAAMGRIHFERVVHGRCERIARVLPPNPQPLAMEFAPYGPSTLAIDGRPLVSSRGTEGAILGRGFRFKLAASERPHRVEVDACRGADGVGGFYLIPR